MSQESFAGLALLERLYLFNNRIQSIHPAAFQELGQLLELKLQGNQLTSLPALRMPKLLLLDLSYNKIPPPEPADLQTPSLEWLNMAGMELKEVDPGLTAGLGNLHGLDLSHNQLQAVPEALREVRGLIRLSLARNPMEKLGPEDIRKLEELKELQELDLSKTHLRGLPQEFRQLMPRLKQLISGREPLQLPVPAGLVP